MWGCFLWKHKKKLKLYFKSITQLFLIFNFFFFFIMIFFSFEVKLAIVPGGGSWGSGGPWPGLALVEIIVIGFIYMVYQFHLDMTFTSATGTFTSGSARGGSRGMVTSRSFWNKISINCNKWYFGYCTEFEFLQFNWFMFNDV